MINNINISNLQLFNKKDNLLPVKEDLQKYLQEGIASKVETLLNTEEFIKSFIPNGLSEQIKLRIYLTKDIINVQILEESPKAPKIEKDLSDNIKTQQEEIIKRVNSLFKELSSLNTYTPLRSKTVHPLSRTSSTPSISSKEELNPYKISFDANVLKSQLDAKVQELQNQIDRHESFSEQLQDIKAQLKFLQQAIQNLSDNAQYSPIKELIANQHTICQELLKLLSKRLQQIPHPNGQQQDTENSSLKEIVTQLKLKEDRINSNLKSLNQLYQETSQILEQKEREIIDLQEKLKAIPNLKLQLSELQKEKESLESQHQALVAQLDQVAQLQAESSINKDAKIEELGHVNIDLQKQIINKDEQIAELQLQIEKQILQLQQEASALEELNKAHQIVEQKEQTLAVLQQDVKKLQMQLLENQHEKKELEAEKAYLTERLITLSEKEESPSALIISQIAELGKDKITLQNQISAKNNQIAELQSQVKEQNKLQNQISTLEKERNTLASALQEQRNIIRDNEVEWKQALSIKENLLSELEKSKTLFRESYLEQLDQKKEKIAELQEKAMHLDVQKNDLQNQLDRSKENQARLQQDLATKEEIISQLQQEKTLLEETNSRINSTIEKNLIDDQRIETMLEQVDLHSSDLREIPSLPLEEPLPIFQANDISPSRQYNPGFYTLYNISNESLSDEDSLASSYISDESFSEKDSLASSLSREQIEEKEMQQSTIAVLQEEIENAAINTPIKEVEKMERKIELLSSKLLEKELAITQYENTVGLLCNRIEQLDEKLASLKKMEPKLENIQREKENLSDDNQNLERRISDLDKKIQTEKTSKANLENDLVNQMEELEQKHRLTIENIKEFYNLILQELLIKKPSIAPDLTDILNNLEKNNPSDILEIIRTLDPSYLKEESSLSFIESKDSPFEGFGESSVINTNIQRPKPPGNWQRKARSSF